MGEEYFADFPEEQYVWHDFGFIEDQVEKVKKTIARLMDSDIKHKLAFSLQIVFQWFLMSFFLKNIIS